MPKGTHRKTPDARDCRQCHKTFKPKVAWQDFCGTPCRRAFWQAGGVDSRAILKIIQPELDKVRARDDELLRAVHRLDNGLRILASRSLVIERAEDWLKAYLAG